MRLEAKIKKLESLIKEIAGTKRKKVPGYDCPLRHNHYELSMILFGLGKTYWVCKFCRTDESS